MSVVAGDCGAIVADYAAWKRSARPRSEADVLHMFSLPRAPEFLATQEAFSAASSWFSVKRLDGISHFPPLELPDAATIEIERF